MHRSFVTAFVSTCADAGLSQEATARLLQKESADQARRDRPAFGAGFDKVASEFPGFMRCELRYGDMEKSAGRFQNIRDMISGLGTMFRGAAGVVGTGLKGVRTGVRTTVGPAGSNSWLQRNPLPVALGMTGLGVGGALALNSAWRRRNDGDLTMGGMAGDPFYSPSGYDPQEYDRRFKERLYNDYGPGIASLNEASMKDSKRRRELEEAVKNNRGGGAAWQELQEIDARRRKSEEEISRYYGVLDRRQQQAGDILGSIGERQKKLESRRDSPVWGWWRGAQRIVGIDPERKYNERIAQLRDTASAATAAQRMDAERAKMLASGYTRPPETATRPKDNYTTSRFFNTY